jgi:hypothetical protein
MAKALVSWVLWIAVVEFSKARCVRNGSREILKKYLEVARDIF